MQEIFAGMVELADTQDLGSCAERCTGSTPATRTKNREITFVVSLFFWCVDKGIKYLLSAQK